MLIFQHGGYCAGGRMLSATDNSSASWSFCGHKTQHFHLIHTEIWRLLFKSRFFPIPSCVDYELMLITFTPGQEDKQCSGHVCHCADPALAHSSAMGSRGLIHTVLSGGGTKTFPHHKLGQEYQRHFAAVRLTDQLPATAGSTSCTPGKGRAMHWLFST